jgi:uncharacterized protein
VGFTAQFQNLPQSIQNFLKHCVKLVEPKKIILFGSRARGNFRENSDFDIAVQGLKFPEQWSKLLVDLENESFTLYKIDLVRIDQLNDDYLRNINNEGLSLYE